jgi:hypothetical protein
MAKAGEMYWAATCRTREQLMKAVLGSGNDVRVHVLERLLLQREQAQRQFPDPEVVEAEGADTWKPILARLSDDELLVLEGLLAGDGEPLATLIEGRARAMAQDMVAAARVEEQRKVDAETDRRIEARRGSDVVDLHVHRRL